MHLKAGLAVLSLPQTSNGSPHPHQRRTVVRTSRHATVARPAAGTTVTGVESDELSGITDILRTQVGLQDRLLP